MRQVVGSTERTRVLVAGAGIGGLAAALACARAGCAVQVVEQAPALSEVGAGIQLGPNAVRRLAAWGLGDALREVAAFPSRLEVRDAGSHALLAALRLGELMAARHGQPYATVHRADLQAMLARAAGRAGATVSLGLAASGYEQNDHLVCLRGDGFAYEGEALIGADGLWSRVREQLLADGPPVRGAHVALRALVEPAKWPAGLQRDVVHAWLGARMHAVAYPVRAGRAFNLVVIVHDGERVMLEPEQQRWNGAIDQAQVLAAAHDANGLLRELLQGADSWRFWALHGRAPVRGAAQMAGERVALLGDAAHPMFPYLAQGAAMALEDAAGLGRQLAMPGQTVREALGRYAQARWARVARVQARSARNGRIFHATGALRLGRDLAMAVLGERLLDLPWLYGG